MEVRILLFLNVCLFILRERERERERERTHVHEKGRAETEGENPKRALHDQMWGLNSQTVRS